MIKSIISASAITCVLALTNNVLAQGMTTSSQIPGVSYLTSTPGSEAMGAVVSATGNTATTTTITGGAILDGPGLRNDSHASATMNSATLTGSRATGAVITATGNTATTTTVSMKTSVMMNTAAVR